MTLKLRCSTTSPYARKVTVTALETGLDGQIERILTNPWSAGTDLVKDNPLGKVPTLITETGERLYDSPVICEYLDSLHNGRKLFPAAGNARWTALRRQALADGIVDAGAAWRIETVVRPAQYCWPDWTERQSGAVFRGLDALENEDFGENFTIGEIAIVAALGFLDFRFPSVDWRDGRSRLAGWYKAIQNRPSVAATVPRD
jgi:glutathione S-transferase